MCSGARTMPVQSLLYGFKLQTMELPCASATDVVPGAVQAPFTYEGRPPADISFVPLKQQQEFNAAALLQATISLA